MIVGWRCAVCGATVDVAEPLAFRCPNVTPDDRHHVLHPIDAGAVAEPIDDPNPFVRYGRRLAWWAFARANGMTEGACSALTRDVADGFAATPFGESPSLSAAVGSGELWVKDETANVGGSHKGRHLVTILLHLRAAEALGLAGGGTRRPLAIASCGNAAVAAATLARRQRWPIDVYVPEWASDAVVTLLGSLGAEVTRCPRMPGDPPGDPSVLRFREAVDTGSVPFSVQGPENALCLDGGRTIGWEIAEDGTEIDRALVQVGGGALAACLGWGLGPEVRIDAVQAAGCAPLARAWQRADELALGPDRTATCWTELMTPWDRPSSAADGILDEETHDWLGVFDVMRRSGGRPVVVSESAIERARDVMVDAGFATSHTGAAGLAALLSDGDEGAAPTRTVVVASGVER